MYAFMEWTKYRLSRVTPLGLFFAINFLSVLFVAKNELDLSYSKQSLKESSNEYYFIPQDILCKGKGITPIKSFQRHPFDPMDLDPLNFLPDYKNPCFLQNVTIKKVTKEHVRCIPFFYIAGMPKSGTTDFWYALRFHPDVILYPEKETFWFNKYRFGKKPPFEVMLDSFNWATKRITKTLSPSLNHKYLPYHHLVTGEGSVDTSFDNDRWTTFKGNENCNEPVILNQHHIRHINPDSKIIFVMRNPVDRIFSDYLYEARYIHYNKSAEDFHVAVVRSLYMHKLCRKYFTLRGCAYNHSIETYKARLRVGMYHIFLEDWLRVFPWNQFVFIKFEEYIKDPFPELKKVSNLLELRPFSKEEVDDIVNRKIRNQRTKDDRKVGDMFPFTRKILEDFYRPFNERLAQLLKDDKFLWNDKTGS